MSAANAMATIVSAYAGAKARSVKRDAIVLGFVCLMALLASFALLGAFAAFVAEIHGPVIGLLAAAALALFLGLVALAIRVWARKRAERRRRAMTTGTASALAVSVASNAIAENKTLVLAAGVMVGLVAGSMLRASRD